MILRPYKRIRELQAQLDEYHSLFLRIETKNGPLFSGSFAHILISEKYGGKMILDLDDIRIRILRNDVCGCGAEMDEHGCPHGH